MKREVHSMSGELTRGPIGTEDKDEGQTRKGPDSVGREEWKEEGEWFHRRGRL